MQSGFSGLCARRFCFSVSILQTNIDAGPHSPRRNQSDLLMKTSMKKASMGLLLAAASACFSSSFAATQPASPAVHLPPGIAWQQGDIDAAFARAKRSNKPLLLYWGAVWCPSCNQVKATVFSQQVFKDRSSFFVPVYLDGDAENAQKLGERFKVRGYPTMILFRPDGTEVTRLPGEADLDRYMQALSLGMNATHPFKQTLAAALRDGAALKPDEWRMLADYSWDTDGGLPVPGERVAQTLQTLAAHARADHAPKEALRFALKAAVTAADGEPAQQGELDKATGLAALQATLNDPRLSREQSDVLVAAPADLVRWLAKDAAERARLSQAYDAALTRLSTDASLSAIDRTIALHGRVSLARLAAPKGTPLPAPPARHGAQAGERHHAGGHQSVRACGRGQRRRGHAHGRRPLRRFGCAARGRAAALVDALLLHVRPRGEREGARRQGGRARVVSQGLRSNQRLGHAAALGRHLPGQRGDARAR